MAEELISINTSLVASPARTRHQKEMTSDEYDAITFLCRSAIAGWNGTMIAFP